MFPLKSRVNEDKDSLEVAISFDVLVEYCCQKLAFVSHIGSESKTQIADIMAVAITCYIRHCACFPYKIPTEFYR